MSWPIGGVAPKSWPSGCDAPKRWPSGGVAPKRWPSGGVAPKWQYRKLPRWLARKWRPRIRGKGRGNI